MQVYIPVFCLVAWKMDREVAFTTTTLPGKKAVENFHVTGELELQ